MIASPMVSSYNAYYAKHGHQTNNCLRKEGSMIPEKRMPPKLFSKAKRIALVVSEDWLRKVGDWRRVQPDFPTLSDAIRRLVDQALDTPKGDKPSKSKPKK
jgi:hypothetical protein